MRYAGRPIDAGPFHSELGTHYGHEWVHLAFDQPVLSVGGAVLLSSKLDINVESGEPSCRIIFSGTVEHIFEGNSSVGESLRVYKVRIAPWGTCKMPKRNR